MSVSVTPSVTITKSVTQTPASSPTLNAPPGPGGGPGGGATQDCHIALSCGQGTPGGMTGQINWFASHLMYFFDDNIRKEEINMLYYKIGEDKYTVSYTQKSVLENNCPTFADGRDLNEFLMIDKAMTKVNGIGMRTESAGRPDSGSLFRGGVQGIISSMAGVFTTVGGPFESVAARGLGDGIDITLLFELVQLDGRSDRNEILQAFIDMKQDKNSSYNFSTYVGHINGVLVAWLPVIAKASEVGGFLWHCLDKVSDPDYDKGYRDTGPGIDGIGNFTGMPRMMFEGTSYQETQLSPAEITKVVVRAHEKKLPVPNEWESFPDHSDECFDPSVAKPAAIQIYHDCGRNDSDPGTWLRGAVKAKLYIDGKYDTSQEGDYTYRNRDFSENYQRGGDTPISAFWFRNDPDSDHGLGDVIIGNNLEDGDYSEVTVIPAFGDLGGEGLACGSSFINPVRIVRKESLNRAILDQENFGSPNREYNIPTFMVGLGTTYKVTVEGEGEVSFPKDPNLPIQCSKRFEYTITVDFTPGQSYRAFFCPDKDNLTLEHINSTMTEQIKIPNEDMPDSYKYEYEFIQDTELELDDATVEIYLEPDEDGYEALQYTLDPTDQKDLDYLKKYIVDICDHPMGKLIAQVTLSNGRSIEYKRYITILEPDEIRAASLSSPNAETDRVHVGITCSLFNRGFFNVTPADHLFGEPEYEKINTGYDCDNFLDETGDFPEKNPYDPYSGGDEVTADSYNNYETEITFTINGHTFSWKNYHKKEYLTFADTPDEDCHQSGSNIYETKGMIRNIYVPFIFDDTNGNDVPTQRMPNGDEVLVEWETEIGTFIDWADRVPGELNFSYSPRIRYNAYQEVKYDLKVKKFKVNSYEEETTVLDTSNQTDLKLYNNVDAAGNVSHFSPMGLETYDIRKDGLTRSWPSNDVLLGGEYSEFVSKQLSI